MLCPVERVYYFMVEYLKVYRRGRWQGNGGKEGTRRGVGRMRGKKELAGNGRGQWEKGEGRRVTDRKKRFHMSYSNIIYILPNNKISLTYSNFLQLWIQIYWNTSYTMDITLVSVKLKYLYTVFLRDTASRKISVFLTYSSSIHKIIYRYNTTHPSQFAFNPSSFG